MYNKKKNQDGILVTFKKRTRKMIEELRKDNEDLNLSSLFRRAVKKEYRKMITKDRIAQLETLPNWTWDKEKGENE